MQEVSLAVAFAAGLVSFASPCVLTLVPVYLAFLGDTASQPGSTLTPARSAVLAQALLFVVGFTAVFVLLGTSLGLLGGALFRIDAVRQVAGIVIIGLGVLSTGILGDPFGRLPLGVRSDLLPAARSARSVALGSMVAVGWTPCIGPVLSTILGMGAASGSAPVAAILLVAYSAGLATPFLLAALGLPRLEPTLRWLQRHHRAVRLVSGLLIVGIGVLVYLNAFARLATLFRWPF